MKSFPRRRRHPRGLGGQERLAAMAATQSRRRHRRRHAGSIGTGDRHPERSQGPSPRATTVTNMEIVDNVNGSNDPAGGNGGFATIQPRDDAAANVDTIIVPPAATSRICTSTGRHISASSPRRRQAKGAGIYRRRTDHRKAAGATATDQAVGDQRQLRQTAVEVQASNFTRQQHMDGDGDVATRFGRTTA